VLAFLKTSSNRALGTSKSSWALFSCIGFTSPWTPTTRSSSLPWCRSIPSPSAASCRSASVASLSRRAAGRSVAMTPAVPKGATLGRCLRGDTHGPEATRIEDWQTKSGPLWSKAMWGAPCGHWRTGLFVRRASLHLSCSDNAPQLSPPTDLSSLTILKASSPTPMGPLFKVVTVIIIPTSLGSSLLLQFPCSIK